MRIISLHCDDKVTKERDYYDSIQAMGQDRSVLYLRNEQTIHNYFPFKHAPAIGQFYRFHRNVASFEQYVIGFCDKVYLMLDVEYQGENRLCYNFKEVDDFITSVYKPYFLESYFNSKYDRILHPEHKQRKIKEIFNFYQDHQDAYKQVFEKHKVPVFIARNTRHQKYTILNGLLKTVEFYRVKDAYTAFQEIYMYLSNQAIPLKPIPEISDEVMSEIKGFDKNSFRKPKQQ